MKGAMDLRTLISYVFLIIMYVVVIAPTLAIFVTDITGLDPTESSIIAFVVPGLAIAIFVSMFQDARGSPRPMVG